MTYPAWFRDGWFLFSVLMTVIIVVFFAIPSVFGFQNFVQWGAMYDDRWCTVVGYESNPHGATAPPRSETQTPGANIERVFSGPTHNRQTCLALARMRCGTQSEDGWTYEWVEPEFQHERYMGDSNVCDLSLPSLQYWFYDAK